MTFSKRGGLTPRQVRAAQKLSRHTAGFFGKLLYHVFMLAVSFIMLYPVLYMLSMTFRPAADMNNPNVVWIPTAFTLSNLR